MGDFSLKGKVAMVTGGNGGIGKAIVRGFASMGCHIAIAARNQEKSEIAAEEIRRDFDVDAIPVKMDLLHEDKVAEAVKKIVSHFSRIDILVNNSGINIRKMPQDYSVEEWDAVLNTNLRGAFICCREVFPSMKATGRGKVINIGSMLSIFGGALLAAYGSSKGGILQFTKSLAVAWARYNIQVNAILPGYINTELTKMARVEITGLEQNVIARTPAGRWGEPEELANCAVFLASPASDFITGVGIPVDGGYSVQM